MSTQMISNCLSLLLDAGYIYFAWAKDFWQQNDGSYALGRIIDNIFFIVPMMS